MFLFCLSFNRIVLSYANYILLRFNIIFLQLFLMRCKVLLSIIILLILKILLYIIILLISSLFFYLLLPRLSYFGLGLLPDKLFFIFLNHPYLLNSVQQHVYNQMFKVIVYLILVALLLSQSSAAVAPFLPFNEIHPTLSQFELNLILNQNRNIPIVMLQYSQDKTLKLIKNILQNAFEKEPDVAFAVLVDCRNFKYDLNNSLGVCRGYSQYSKQEHSQSEQEDTEKITDPFIKLNLFSPNPTRILQKGHTLSKSHDVQDLRELGVGVSSDFLAKVLKNQIPDFAKYIQDSQDLQDFLKINSQFRLSKGPKLLYFDQNLQSPLFLKKLAMKLDGWIQIGVSDSFKIAASYNCQFDDIILLEYDFQQQKYHHTKIHINLDGNALNDVLEHQLITGYTKIRKPRDILLDFQHKTPLLYNFTDLKQLNQLLSHGRILLLQVSKTQNDFKCEKLSEVLQNVGVLFNYVCFSKENINKLLTAIQFDEKENHWSTSFFMIDGYFKNTKVLSNKVKNIFEHLPKVGARQQISSTSQGELCIKAAKAAEKQPIFYYFNQKTHSNSINILKYLGSLAQVNSIIYFCQFYAPDQQVTQTYHLTENTAFSLGGEERQGQLQKIEHSKMQDFLSAKMFIREVALSRMIKVYDDKVIKNQIYQIKTAEELTQNCFSNKCIIGLIETGKFHQQTQMKILKEMQIANSDQGYKFYWIDGICHFEVGKQLKLTEKGAKNIDRSFLFLYQEKGNAFSLWKTQKINKFWDKKGAFRWIKSLKNPASIGRIKFGIDLQDKVCARQKEIPKDQKAVKTKSRTQNKAEVKQEQL